MDEIVPSPGEEMAGCCKPVEGRCRQGQGLVAASGPRCLSLVVLETKRNRLSATRICIQGHLRSMESQYGVKAASTYNVIQLQFIYCSKGVLHYSLDCRYFAKGMIVLWPASCGTKRCFV